MRPDTFRAMLKRQDRGLDIRFGLHPDQKIAVDLGEEVPYARRVYCWTIGQVDTARGWHPLRPLLDPEGRPRDPYEQDMHFLKLGSIDQMVDVRGEINPHKSERWNREVLGQRTEDEHDAEALKDWENKMADEHVPRLAHAMNKLDL